MSLNRKARNKINITYFNNQIQKSVIVCCILVLLISTSLSVFATDNIEPNTSNLILNDVHGNDHSTHEHASESNDYAGLEISNTNFGSSAGDYPVAAYSGFIYPKNLDNYNGIATDVDGNGIEDFIERTNDDFLNYEYIDTIITLTLPATEELLERLLALDCRIDQVFTVIDGLGATIPVNKLELIGRLPGVEMVQSVHHVEPKLSDAVPLVKASQSKLKSEGYNGIDGSGVTIAVIDSGIDGNHNTFGNRIIAFRDFVNNNNDLDPTDGMTAYDTAYHGTMCGSCAAGNGLYKGVAINSNIIGVAVWSTYQMIQGIQWCVDNRNKDFNKDGTPDGPDIITMSLGLQVTQRTSLDVAAEAAMDNGIVFVTSAGNDGPGAGTVTSPATSYKVISVGATNKYNMEIADFSSRGPGPGGIIKPDVVAPGHNIIVAYPSNQWTYGSGTSFSGPIVAGVAALLLQYDPDLTPYEIKDILKESAIDLGDTGPDNTYGWGFIDTIAALNLVLKVKTIEASEYNVIEDTNVAFTATASGTNVETYDWDFENDGKYDLTTEIGSASKTFMDEGTYEIKVRIKNTQGKTAENSVQIQVNNRLPDADLKIDGEPEYIYEDDVLTFNSSDSWDTPSDIEKLEFSWSFNNGANFTNFSKQDKLIEHPFPKTGEYTIKVRVRDDNDEIVEDAITFSVYNMKPLANAGSDKFVFEDELVLFTGFESYDTTSDWPVLEYYWDFGDGNDGDEMNMTHTYQTDYNNETFFITLTVTDNDNEKSQAKIKVTVQNRAPSVQLEHSISGYEDDMIELTGIANDSKNDINELKFLWDFDDGESTNWLDEPTVLHTYTKMGTYYPKLTVKDPKDKESSNRMIVTIDNVAPTADFTMDKSDVEEDEVIIFDASNSADTSSDFDDLKYTWDFGNSEIKFGKIISYQFFKNMKYPIKLTVSDDDGAFSTMETEISVTNRKPSASLRIDKVEFEVLELVRLYGYKSTDTPSDKLNLTYYWNFDDGSGWEVAGINATHRYSNPGEYEIKLKIEDDDLEVDVNKVTIDVVQVKDTEDIYENPTISNSGLLIYAGMGLFVVILILILLSMLMYYRNKGGIFGVVERKLKKRREKREEKQRAANQPVDYDFQHLYGYSDKFSPGENKSDMDFNIDPELIPPGFRPPPTSLNYPPAGGPAPGFNEQMPMYRNRNGSHPMHAPPPMPLRPTTAGVGVGSSDSAQSQEILQPKPQFGGPKMLPPSPIQSKSTNITLDDKSKE